MAICDHCNLEMETARSCVVALVEYPDGHMRESIPYGSEADGLLNVQPHQRCHDCNVEQGGYHHPGCDVEECPECHTQLISCGCLNPKEEDEEDVC